MIVGRKVGAFSLDTVSYCYSVRLLVVQHLTSSCFPARRHVSLPALRTVAGYLEKNVSAISLSLLSEIFLEIG